jgi:hypothetical protein
MKGMLGEIPDTRSSFWKSLTDWKRYWRLRLIHWIAGERAVVMNIGVDGMLVAYDEQEILTANFFVTDLRMFEMRTMLVATLQKVLEMRSMIFKAYTEKAEAADRGACGEFVDVTQHPLTTEWEKLVAQIDPVCGCGHKRGMRIIQDRLNGGGWGSPRWACMKCRKGVLRGLFRVIREASDLR